jgi:hypothetical protein
VYWPVPALDVAGCAPVLSITALISALRLTRAIRSLNWLDGRAIFQKKFRRCAATVENKN